MVGGSGSVTGIVVAGAVVVVVDLAISSSAGTPSVVEGTTGSLVEDTTASDVEDTTPSDVEDTATSAVAAWASSDPVSVTTVEP